MVTRRLMGITESVNRQWPFAALVGVLVTATLGFVIMSQFGGIALAYDVPADSLEQLGLSLVSHQGFLLPFELASVLLLAALIGSIVVARD